MQLGLKGFLVSRSTVWPRRCSARLMFVMRLTVVADELHPSNHCSYCKEAENLGANYTDSGQLLTVDVADAVEKRLRVDP